MRVPRWTTSLACAGLLGAVLSGCRSREHAFRATRVPVVRFDSVLKTADSVRLPLADARLLLDRKSTRLNSSHVAISYAVFCLKKKKDGNCRTRRWPNTYHWHRGRSRQ